MRTRFVEYEEEPAEITDVLDNIEDDFETQGLQSDVHGHAPLHGGPGLSTFSSSSSSSSCIGKLLHAKVHLSKVPDDSLPSTLHEYETEKVLIPDGDTLEENAEDGTTLHTSEEVLASCSRQKEKWRAAAEEELATFQSREVFSIATPEQLKQGGRPLPAQCVWAKKNQTSMDRGGIDAERLLAVTCKSPL